MKVTSILGIINEYTSIDAIEEIIRDIKSREDYHLYSNVRVEFEIHRGYYDDIDVTVKIEGTREETEEETRLRLHRDEESKADRIARLKRELKQLIKGVNQ